MSEGGNISPSNLFHVLSKSNWFFLPWLKDSVSQQFQFDRSGEGIFGTLTKTMISDAVIDGKPYFHILHLCCLGQGGRGGFGGEVCCNVHPVSVNK